MKIDTDNENSQPATHDHPVNTISPLSQASSDFGIKHGGMSLESSTSGENKERLAAVLKEIQQEMCDQIRLESQFTREQIDFGEELTADIMQHLVAELRHDFLILVNREASQLLRQQQEQMQAAQQIQGIKTDLFAIERYVDEIVEEVKSKFHD